MRYSILSALILSLVFSACHKPDDPVICTGRYSKARVEAGFIGYSRDELDTIITRRYTRGSNFAQLIDTIVVVDTNMYMSDDTTLRRYDTAFYRGFATLLDDYDYEVVVPAANKSYRVTDISYVADSTYTFASGWHGCALAGLPHFKYCLSLVLDSQSLQPVATAQSGFPFPVYSFSTASLLYLRR